MVMLKMNYFRCGFHTKVSPWI